jgi:hypothetical protein
MTVFAFGGGAMPTGNPGLGYVLAVVGGAILAAQ